MMLGRHVHPGTLLSGKQSRTLPSVHVVGVTVVRRSKGKGVREQDEPVDKKSGAGFYNLN